METQFYIVAMLAIVVRNTLANETPAYTKIQNQIMTDYSTIRGLNRVANLAYQEAATILFDYLKNAADNEIIPGSKNPPKTNLYSTKTAVLNALTTQVDVTLLAIQTVTSGDHSGISAALEVVLPAIEKWIEDLFRGIVLAQDRESSSHNLAIIEAFAAEASASVENVNAAIYGAFQYHNTPTLFIEACQSAQKKSLIKLQIAAASPYTGIKALMGVLPSGKQADKDSILATIQSARSQALSMLTAEIEIKYGFMYKLFLALSIIQLGTVTDDSLIHAIESLEIADYREALDSIFIQLQSNSTLVDSEMENEAKSKAIEGAEEVSQAGAKFGLTMMFETMIFEHTRVTNGDGDATQGDCSVTALSKKNEYLVFRDAIDSYFNATLTLQPGASSAVMRVQDAIHSGVVGMVRGVKEGIDLFRMQNCSEISAKIEAIEEATISAAVSTATNVFIPIKYGHESHSKIGKKIDRAQEEAISVVIGVYQNVFTAIKILLSDVFPQLEVDSCSSSIEALQNETTVLFSSGVATVYSAIRAIQESPSEHHIDMTTETCAY